MSDTPPPPDPSMQPPPPPPSDVVAAPAASVIGGPGPIGKPRSIFMVLVLTIVTLGIWTLVWSFQNGSEIKRHANTGIGGLGYLFITLLVAPVTMFLMASEVEQLYRRQGMEPPITTIWGLWFLLPVLGNLIWYVRIQQAINDYWVTSGSTAQPGL
jgi:hypothetical protein